MEESPATLYSKLLKLSEREEEAFRAEDLDELATCVQHRSELLHQINDFEAQNLYADAADRERRASQLMHVSELHERALAMVQVMLGQCGQAILDLGTRRRARRAYRTARRQHAAQAGESTVQSDNASKRDRKQNEQRSAV